MDSKKKFDLSLTKKLITLKHSNYYMEKFKDAEGNSKRLQKVGQELTNEGNPEFSSKELKIKYNSLLSTYKQHNDDAKRSGAAAVKWKYWQLFNETISKRISDSIMQDNEEVGLGSLSETEIRLEQTEISCPKISSIKTKTNLKNIYLQKAIEYMDLNSESLNNHKIIKEIHKLNKRINKINHKVKLILRLLNKK